MLRNLTWRDALIICLTLGVGFLFWQASPAAADQQPSRTPLSSGFSYQGRLTSNGFPVDEACDMRFSLFDAEHGGSQFGASQAIANVPVEAGLFNVMLNSGDEFGSSAFNGAAGWLEIEVNCPAGSSNYSTLTPRQQLTAVPYALGLRGGAIVDGGEGLGIHATNSSPSQYALRATNHSSSGNTASFEKLGGSGVALWGRNLGTTGSGTVGYSANWYGVYGYTGASNNNYGFYSPDNLFSRNVRSAGPTTIVAHNSSPERLQPGAVVAFSGIHFPAELAGDPLIQVDLADRLPNAALAGVVYGDFDPALLNAPAEGVVDSAEVTGEYVLIVIHGPARVEASQITGTFATGESLAVAGDQLRTGGSGRTIGAALAREGQNVWIFVNP